MRTIRISYKDWWGGFNADSCLINQILKKYYIIEESDNPDYIISSVYSKEALNYSGIRIFYTPENFSPDFNLFDYAIGFDDITFGDRYNFTPNYIMNLKYKTDIERMLKKHKKKDLSEYKKEDFCSYVVSNFAGDGIRDKIFDELCKYKRVNSGGRHRNNIGLPDGVEDKYEFQMKHKFSICFENSSHKGYVTEKLIQGFAAETVPIYWGAPDVTNIFNKNAMIEVGDDLSEAVERVMEIDADDEAYFEMLKQPALLNENYIDELYLKLESFLLNIFNQEYNLSKRRAESTTVYAYYTK